MRVTYAIGDYIGNKIESKRNLFVILLMYTETKLSSLISSLFNLVVFRCRVSLSVVYDFDILSNFIFQ